MELSLPSSNFESNLSHRRASNKGQIESVNMIRAGVRGLASGYCRMLKKKYFYAQVKSKGPGHRLMFSMTQAQKERSKKRRESLVRR